MCCCGQGVSEQVLDLGLDAKMLLPGSVIAGCYVRLVPRISAFSSANPYSPDLSGSFPSCSHKNSGDVMFNYYCSFPGCGFPPGLLVKKAYSAVIRNGSRGGYIAWVGRLPYPGWAGINAQAAILDPLRTGGSPGVLELQRYLSILPSCSRRWLNHSASASLRRSSSFQS